jgi:dTDP-4-amino-4,6-dideoxygalactose transaminase
MIPVTKPFSPPLAEYTKLLEGIWDRNWFTNNGPLVNQLELQLKAQLDLPHLLFLNNGTIALQIAIKALQLKGEIITTPFSYVATTSSIVWEGCRPVFVDIDSLTLNIDPAKIEAAVTTDTSAILATHVYGNPCDIDAIQKIADKYNLKVIYDAAHCFGTLYNNKSVFAYGDISTTSFHSTKLFHTIEGGAVFTMNPELLKKMSYLRNFGHEGPEHFAEVGINGKNSEFHAAMGLCNLKYIEEIKLSRRLQSERYTQNLINNSIRHIRINPLCSFNYAYYPIILESEQLLEKVVTELEANLVKPRRYFYPSLNTVSIYKTNKFLEVSESVSRRVLCLPLFHSLSFDEIDFISRILLRAINNK